MRIQKLNSDTKKNLLEDLLKRSPNNYGQYEASVKEILDKVKEEKMRQFLHTLPNLMGQSLLQIRLKSQMQKLKKHMRRLMIHFLQSSAKQKTISKIIMQNSVRTAGLTVNRTELFLGRRSLRFTESACMCREERQFIRLRY